MELKILASLVEYTTKYVLVLLNPSLIDTSQFNLCSLCSCSCKHSFVEMIDKQKPIFIYYTIFKSHNISKSLAVFSERACFPKTSIVWVFEFLLHNTAPRQLRVADDTWQLARSNEPVIIHVGGVSSLSSPCYPRTCLPDLPYNRGCGVPMCQLSGSNDIVNVRIAGNKVQPNDLLTGVTWRQ